MIYLVIISPGEKEGISESKTIAGQYENDSLGVFDITTDPQYDAGKALSKKFRINDLTLCGDLAIKEPWIKVIAPLHVLPVSNNKVSILFGNENYDNSVFSLLLEFCCIDDYPLFFD